MSVLGSPQKSQPNMPHTAFSSLHVAPPEGALQGWLPRVTSCPGQKPGILPGPTFCTQAATPPLSLCPHAASPASHPPSWLPLPPHLLPEARAALPPLVSLHFCPPPWSRPSLLCWPSLLGTAGASLTPRPSALLVPWAVARNTLPTLPASQPSGECQVPSLCLGPAVLEGIWG